MTAPSAPLLTFPTGATSINRGIVNRFAWTFSDVDTGDAQSQFDLRYRLIGAGSWTDVNGVTSSSFKDIAGGTFAAGDYEWQARTYDLASNVGPYSASEFFTAAALPSTPTLTAPTAGSSVSVTSTVSWTATNQDAYQMRRVADDGGIPLPGTVYADTGTVIEVSTRSTTVAFPANGQWEHVQLRIRYQGLWSDWATARVSVSYDKPPAGSVSLAGDADTASLVVTFANSTAPVGSQPAAASVDIYIKPSSERGYGTRYATGLSPAGNWRWWLPVSGVDYIARIVTVGTNGATTWSPAVIDRILNGGVPGANVLSRILDGGTPSTITTHVLDGGIP